MVYSPYSQQYKDNYNAGSDYQYSLQECPTNLLAHQPNTKRGQLRPDGWGSIQKQKTTIPQKNESTIFIFYAAIAILTIAIVYKILQALSN